MTMSWTEIKGLYPTCPIAVGWAELVYNNEESRFEGKETLYDMCRRLRYGPERVINHMRGILLGPMSHDWIHRDTAIAQLDDPNFKKYLAGRLGMM